MVWLLCWHTTHHITSEVLLNIALTGVLSRVAVYLSGSIEKFRHCRCLIRLGPVHQNPHMLTGVQSSKKESRQLLFCLEATKVRRHLISAPVSSTTTQSKKHDGFKPYCPYYIKTEALSNAYANFPKFISTQQSAQADWIKKKKTLEVWRARPPDKCTVIKPCSTCGEPHLPVLHDIALTENVLPVLFPVWF